MSLHTVTGTLPTTAPFDFSHSLKFLGAFKPAMGQQSVNNAALSKAFYVGDKVAVFQATASGTPRTARTGLYPLVGAAAHRQ